MSAEEIINLILERCEQILQVPAPEFNVREAGRLDHISEHYKDLNTDWGKKDFARQVKQVIGYGVKNEASLRDIQRMCDNVFRSPLPSLHPMDQDNIHALIMFQGSKYQDVGLRFTANDVLAIMGYPSRLTNEQIAKEKEENKMAATRKKIDLDKLLDFLVSTSGFKSIVIQPLEGALYEDSKSSERYLLEVHHGPKSDYLSYRCKSIAAAFESFAIDICDLAEEKASAADDYATEAKYLKEAITE